MVQRAARGTAIAENQDTGPGVLLQHLRNADGGGELRAVKKCSAGHIVEIEHGRR